MPKDWGLKWKIRYIPKLHQNTMNKLIGIVIAVIVVGVVSTFVLSPYFTESTIDEAIPTGAITQSEVMNKDIVPTKQDEAMMEEEKMMKDEAMMEEEKMMKDEAMMEEEKMMKDEAMMEEEKMMKDEAMMEEEKMMKDEAMMEEEKMMKDEAMMEEEKMMKDEAMMEEEKMMKDEAMMEEEITEIVPMSFAGKFVGVGDGIHDAQGDAYTIPLEDGNEILRLENFKSTNGPDLYVYLATDENAADFVSLGTLKASSGNQNYDIPEDTDLSKYNKVLVWCKAFGVLFGSAELSTQ